MLMLLADAQDNAPYRTLNQILKGENGFQGYVMSDWGAHHLTFAAVAGEDVSLRDCRRIGPWLTRAAGCLWLGTSTSARATVFEARA